MTSSRPSVFLLKMIGEIETAEFVNEEELYFTYLYCYGQDWEVVKGIEEGSSQTTRRSEDERRIFVWNFPLDVTFKSTNPFGWPQLVICLYGLDSFGNDVIRGYAVCHLPISPGRYTKRLPTFVPASASTLQRFVSWLSARRPEFVDPKTIAQGNGREVIRVTSEGSVSITFDVIFKDFSKLGYNSGQMQRNKIDSIISTNVKEVGPDLQQPSTSKGFRKQNS